MNAYSSPSAPHLSTNPCYPAYKRDGVALKLDSREDSISSIFSSKNVPNAIQNFPRNINIDQLSRQSANLPGPVISFHDVGYTIRVRNNRGLSTRQEKLLHDISGIFKPGMNAIMGPTGCGKTTLLDILAERKEKQETSGTVLIDGVKQPYNFKSIAGYVVQDDLVMGTLTVRENLMFSANMRLPPEVSSQEKQDRVESIIQQLGLSKCADTKVGTEFVRGVSGGERKRTCIGMELIVSPSILFLDEPTTGLDAFTANSVMTLLHRLSRKGLTVVFSIHQPRYSIFKLFDSFMLLAAGNVIYHGHASQALKHFSDQNLHCEQHDNPPDFFLDVINGDVTSLRNSSNQSSISCHKPCDPDILYENLKYGRTDIVGLWDDDSGVFESSVGEVKEDHVLQLLISCYRKSLPCQGIKSELDEIMLKFKNSQKSPSSPRLQKYATSFLTQLFYVSQRTTKNVIRNPTASIAQLLLMLVFGLIVGGLYYDITDDVQKAVQDRAGAFFFIIIIQMFGNLSAIELFIRERKLFLHESRSGFYRVSVYFLSKVFFDLIPLRIFPLFIFCIITYFLMGLVIAADKFFIFFLILFLTSLTSAALTFTISACVNLLAIANVLVGLSYIIMTLFGGLLLNVSSIPKWLNWLQYFSIVRYSFKTLLINELTNATFYIYANNTLVANDTQQSILFLQNQGILSTTAWHLWQNVLALSLGSAALLLCCYLLLLRLASRR